MAIQTCMKLTVWFLLASSAAVLAFAPSRPVASRPSSVASRPVLVELAAESKGGGLMDRLKSGLGGGTAEKEKEDSAVVAVVEETATNGATNGELKAEEEHEDEKAKGFKAIKEAGRAGAISLFLWEAAFWIIAVPIVTFGYRQTTGHFPDFSDKNDLAILGAEVVAFANVARFALPLRIGLAITTIPWVQGNVVDRFWPENPEEQ